MLNLSTFRSCNPVVSSTGVGRSRTLDDLRLLKQARERAGREITELDSILKKLSARDIELRGDEKPQSGMKK